jgi:hypothetical protein
MDHGFKKKDSWEVRREVNGAEEEVDRNKVVNTLCDDYNTLLWHYNVLTRAIRSEVGYNS